MLVTGIHTRTLLPFSIPSSRNTTEFLPAPSTLLTWMLEKLRVTLLKMSQSTLAEFVLVAPLMDLVFPPESPRNNVLELKSLWLRLSRASQLTLLVNTTHLLACRNPSANNWLMITSCLCLENLVARLASPVISPTSTDWDTLRSNWSRK